jgi:rod shape-determining protein MreD
VSTSRALLGAAVVVAAVLLQSTVLAALPLPGAPPELLVVVVVAFALADGPLPGTVVGFGGGLLADLLSDHELGRLALALAVVGHVVGLHGDDPEHRPLLPFAAVAAGAAGTLLLYAAEGVLIGDPRVGAAEVVRSLVSSVPYAVVLTPFVVPVVGVLVRRLDPGRDERSHA